MGLTKSDIFTKQQNEIAAIAKVLGHPARIAILQELQKKQGCICGDLVGAIGLAQPTISQHLKEMKNIGIIKGEISGTSVCYCIDYDRLDFCKSMFDKLLNNGIITQKSILK